MAMEPLLLLTLTKVFASPTCWPVFQNDNFFPNNKFSVLSHVKKYVLLGTAKLNDVDPQRDSKNSMTGRGVLIPILCTVRDFQQDFKFWV